LIFERKILRRIFGPCIDEITGERWIRKIGELKQLDQKPDIGTKRNIKKETPIGRTHAQRKEETFVRMVQCGAL